MHAPCMATKTISVDLEAYQRLRKARLTPGESFSKVIKRARWEVSRKTCGELLTALTRMPIASEQVVERLERAQAEDTPPDSPWHE